MGFYNLNPDSMKELQSPDAGELLHRDGRNISSVVARIAAERPMQLERVRSYLSTIVPEITDFERIALGPRETIEFRQKVVGSTNPWKFYASSVPDGTLRALGTLVAVTQLVDRKLRVRLVGIEEPETALHPAAASSLMDALLEAKAILGSLRSINRVARRFELTSIPRENCSGWTNSSRIELLNGESLEVCRPVRVSRNRIHNTEELKRAVSYARLKLKESQSQGQPGLVPILLDADRDLPCRFGAEIIPDDPELSRNGKGWITRRFVGPRYSETADQPAMTRRIDLSLCRKRSASFDKLCRELERRLTDRGSQG